MHTQNVQNDTQVVERRATPRRRMLKSGIVTPDGNLTVLDCVTRNLSEGGARIDVAAAFAVPKEMVFKIRDSDFTRHARVVWRGEKNVGLQFITEL